MKTLKAWHCGGRDLRKGGDPLWESTEPHTSIDAYIRAYSRADAVRVAEQYTGTRRLSDYVLSIYADDCFLDEADEKIPRERGLWLEFNADGKFHRVV